MYICIIISRWPLALGCWPEAQAGRYRPLRSSRSSVPPSGRPLRTPQSAFRIRKPRSIMPRQVRTPLIPLRERRRGNGRCNLSHDSAIFFRAGARSTRPTASRRRAPDRRRPWTTRGLQRAERPSFEPVPPRAALQEHCPTLQSNPKSITAPSLLRDLRNLLVRAPNTQFRNPSAPLGRGPSRSPTGSARCYQM